MRDTDSIEEIEKIELNEQYDALRRARCLSNLSAINKRWLSQAVKFKKLLAAHTPHKGVGFVAQDLHQAVEATLVLSDPSVDTNDKLRFKKALSPKALEWTEKALVDQDVFDREAKSTVKDEYSPVTYAMAMAVALDDKLFNAQHPDVLTLAVLNAQQYWRGMWPKSLGQKVQHALEKRMVKELDPIKKLTPRSEMVEYIEDKLLDPIVEQDKYKDEDSIKVKTISEAALKMGIVLDHTYFWRIRDLATERGASGMDLIAREQMKKHAELRKKQNLAFFEWLRNRPRITKKNG